MLKNLSILAVILGAVYSAELFEKLEDNTIIVNTANGKIKGQFGARSHANKNQILYWYRSIPFAEPPVGNLRFAPPVAKANWPGVLDVRKKPAKCVQDSSPPSGEEDCLFLKIYSAHPPNKKLKLPVVVWIYGGAFFGGAADFDDHSPDFLLSEDVIVVAIHYRVGFLGFMSLGDTLAPGNNGIKDQILALKWIKRNIDSFGGDPEKITIWGQSAGAASVAYLLQTDQTKGLFSKAILNSGSSLSSWALSTNLPKATKNIAKQLNVSTKTSESILKGLREVSAHELQTIASSVMQRELMTSNPLQGLVYTPVIEPNHPGAVLTEYSHQMLKYGKFHHVPIMAGYTSLEGYFDELPAILKVWLAKYDLYPPQLVPNDMNASSLRKLSMGSRIKSRYFGNRPIATSTTKLMRFISDSQFEKSIQESIRLYSEHTNVYAYHFSYEGALWGRTNRKYDGVGHTEDLGYIFDLDLEGSEQDYLTRRRVVKLWTNFIKYGNPTPKKDSLLQNVIWPTNSLVKNAKDLKFLEINSNFSIVGLPNADNILFWNDLYQRYGRPPFSTY